MATMPVPEGYRTVTPCLMVRRADQAIEFYKRACNAKERSRMQGRDEVPAVHPAGAGGL